MPVVGNHDVDQNSWLDKKSAMEVYCETMFPKLKHTQGQVAAKTQRK